MWKYVLVILEFERLREEDYNSRISWSDTLLKRPSTYAYIYTSHIYTKLITFHILHTHM